MTKVLIVDDSAVDRLLVKSLVESSGRFTVIEADHAKAALEKLGVWDIDIIVTDMQMPEMDGLQLLETVRKLYPDIPTILATGVGSSEIASLALSQGAAGYVPKSKLSELLVPTINNLLERQVHSDSFSRLLDCSRDICFDFSLENDATLFAPLIDLVVNMIGGISPMSLVDRMRVGVAIEQALHNALYRGNLEMPSGIRVPFGDEFPKHDTMQVIEERQAEPEYQDRKIDVRVNLDPAKIVCRVADQGPGFDPEFQQDSLADDSGRGLTLIRTFMDHVEFNEKGNEITMTAAWRNEATVVSDKEGAADNELGRLTCMSSNKEISLQQVKCVVGAHRSSHLIIRHKDVAKHHCVFVYQKGHWWVKDLESETGTRVNGKKIKQTRLQPNDLIAVGPRELKIEYSQA